MCSGIGGGDNRSDAELFHNRLDESMNFYFGFFGDWINYEQAAAEAWWMKHFQWKPAALHELWKEPRFELILRRPIWSRFIPRWSFRRWRAKT